MGLDSRSRPPVNSTANGGSRKEQMARFELGQLLATPGVLEAAAGEDLSRI